MNITSSKVKLTSVYPNGVKAQTLSVSKYPDKNFSQTIIGEDTTYRIFNGDRGVSIDSKKLKSSLNKQEINLAKVESLIFPHLYYKKLGFQLEYLGETIQGNDTLKKVKIKEPFGGTYQYHYFDKKSGLLRIAELPDYFKIEVNAYKKINDITYSSSGTYILPNFKIEFKVEEITYNDEVDPDIFDWD